MHTLFEEAMSTTKGPLSHAIGHPQTNRLGFRDRLRHTIRATPRSIKNIDFFFPVFWRIFQCKTATLCYIM